MKVLTCFLCAAVVSAITVPPTWPRSPTSVTPNPRRPHSSRPHRLHRNTQYHRPIRTTPRPHLIQTTQGDWIPVAPPFVNQHKHYVVHETTTTRSKTHANKNIPFSPVTGSRIHLAPKYTPGPDHQLVDSVEHRLPDGDELIKANYETPVSEHEYPKDIPTRPIYPGEGQWAKPKRKHRPHNSPYKYNEPIKSQEEERPDGYDIFERGQERFRLAQNKHKTPKREPIKQSQDDEDEKQGEEFVPEKLYAQVRKTEIKKHLPRSHIKRDEEENADRLREVIKDSKIQTVYTEEGYEDSAYDHAGKEKKAESEEGHIRKAEEVESLRKNNNNHKQGQYSDKRGHNRGRTKHRRIKNQNEVAKTHNYDDTETYHDVKQKVEKELSDSEIGETLNQAIKVPSNDKVGSRSNLHQSKQQKIEIKSTMKNGDDINMEIHTEVKFINGSDKRKHKFVKIVPSYQRVIEPDTQSIYDSSETEVDSSEETYHRRVKRYDREMLSKKYVRKRPDYYWKRKKTESTKTTHYVHPITIKIKRQKRYTIDYPNIEVPTINFQKFQKVSLKNKPKSDNKYPYLKVNTKVLNENSPLRYAENLDKIPQKSQDDMAFYKSRSRTKCSEIEEDVDPIPEKIKNMQSEEASETDEDKEENSPRLQGLGDKIDCLKIKYFGEDPLDSPIFKEDTISVAVPTIFKKITRKRMKQPNFDIKKENKKESISPDDQFEEIDITPKKSTKRNVESFDPIVVASEEDSNTTINPINIQRDAVLKPPYTLKEVADKILKNRTVPNNIYDQINLLAVHKEHITEEKKKTPNFVIVYDNQSTEANSVQNDQIVEDKINNINITDGFFNPQLSDVVSDLSHYSEELPSYEINNLVPENFSEYDLLLPVNENSKDEDYLVSQDEENENAQYEEKDNNPDIQDSYLPTHAALRDYRYFSQFATKFRPSMRNTFKINTPPKFSSIIFDISKYLPQIKNHKSVTSEVQYKEDIKPSEQLNVYSDVLRAINSSTQEDKEAKEVFNETQPITVKLHIANNTRTRNPKRKIRIKTTTVSSIVDLLTKPEDSYEENSNNINNIKKGNFSNMDKTSPQIFPTEVPNPPKILPEKIRSMINQYTQPLIIKVPNASQESLEISGLAPPPSLDFKYRTIPITYPAAAIPVSTKLLLKPIAIRQSKNNVNLYYFTGLRPPSKKQLVMNYNDFNKIKRNKRHLSLEQEEDMFAAESNNEEKRVSRKPIMYTEIVRQRNPSPKRNEEEEEEEEDEDLLPRKRTYDINLKPRTTTTEQTVNEEDYYEIEEPAMEKPIKKEPLVFENPTGLPEYIKVIDKLHEYRFVNNITTTLPEQETTTANPRTTTTPKTQTTAESINKGVPAFLQIINSLHDTRKEQEPEEKSDTRDEIVEEEDYEPSKPVQNSNPYISSALTSRNEENNEEIDTQAHIRNLSNKFKTSIDTSKYKTIERMPIMLRHNLSSRYNADDEILPLERIFTTKMPAYTTTVRNEEKELILQREYSPQSRSEDIIEDDEETTVATTTKATRRRTGPRRRPTTTSRAWETTTKSQIVRRRRPQRVQVSSTTTETPISTTSSSPRRRYRQRLEPQTSIKSYVSEIPPNHKREYVPITEIASNGEIKEDFKRPNDINKNTWKKLYDRRIMTHRPLIKIPQESRVNEKDDEVEIFEEIKNPNMKHGGNYRHIDDKEVQDKEDEQTTSKYRFPIRRRQNIVRSTEPTTTQNVFEDINEEEAIIDQEEKPIHKPKIIKDPSKRMYFYAKL